MRILLKLFHVEQLLPEKDSVDKDCSTWNNSGISGKESQNPGKIWRTRGLYC